MRGLSGSLGAIPTPVVIFNMRRCLQMFSAASRPEKGSPSVCKSVLEKIAKNLSWAARIGRFCLVVVRSEGREPLSQRAGDAIARTRAACFKFGEPRTSATRVKVETRGGRRLRSRLAGLSS